MFRMFAELHKGGRSQARRLALPAQNVESLDAITQELMRVNRADERHARICDL
jgi:hypothetical protein